MTVLDLSHYDLPTLDPPCFKSSGVTGVICAVYSDNDAPNRMRQAAQSCRNAGLAIHGFYGFIYFGSPTGEVRDTNWAIALAKEFGVSRVWLDCEVDGKGIFGDASPVTPAKRIAAIKRSVKMVEDAGLSPGIYTGSWWWPSGTGNSTEFAHLPLWNSYYDQDPDIDGLPYGGWATAAVEQYSSTITVCGRVRDHNKIYEEEDDMTAEEKKMLKDVYDAVCGRGNQPAGQQALDEWNDNGNSFILGLSIDQGRLLTHTHDGPGAGPTFPE